MCIRDRNHLVRQYYEQNSHIVLIDTGNSYQGLCELIHRKTKSEDGIYYTYCLLYTSSGSKGFASPLTCLYGV